MTNRFPRCPANLLHHLPGPVYTRERTPWISINNSCRLNSSRNNFNRLLKTRNSHNQVYSQTMMKKKEAQGVLFRRAKENSHHHHPNSYDFFLRTIAPFTGKARYASNTTLKLPIFSPCFHRITASVPESLALGLDSLSVGGISVREAEGVIRLDDGTELPRPQHLGPISREGYAQLQVYDRRIIYHAL